MSRFTNPISSGDGGSSTDTFDKIYVTNNGNGTNIKVGDDIWFGDVDVANHVAIRGVEDSVEGGLILGDQGTAIITGNNNELNLHAFSNVNISADAAPGWINLSAYEGAYVNGIDPDNKIATIKDLPGIMAYGAFHDENSFGPYASNTEHALSYETTDMNSNVHIGGINNSEIITDVAGKFNIQFSTQFHVTSSSAIVYVWLKKNGTSMPWTNTRVDIAASNPYAVLAWNWFVEANANDSFEIYWSSPSATVVIQAITGLTGTKPNVPSNILTVNQIG